MPRRDVIKRRNLAQLPYAHEKLGEALQILATHPGSIRARLRAAAEPLLMVPVSSLSPSQAKRYASVMRRLTRHPGAPGPFAPSRVGLSLKGLHEPTMIVMAEAVVRLDAEVEAELEIVRAPGRSRRRR